LQQSNSPDKVALAAFAQLMGLDPDLLSDAYTTLKAGSEIASDLPALGRGNTALNGSKTKKNYLNKELIYEDEAAFLYQRGDTKGKTYYLRIFDQKSGKPFVKSLGTSDRPKALVKARTIYQEIKGKIDRGERLRSISSSELVELYLGSLHISDIPHTGVTPDTLKLKRYFLKVWLEFVITLGHKQTPIDRLPEDQLRNFGKWFREKPREDSRTGPRSVEQINNAISEVRLAYYKVGVRNRYISVDRVPDIDRLKQQPNSAYKRDILELHQYDKYWRFLEYKYQRQKDLDPIEQHRRIIFTKFVGIMVNTGMRPREFLTLKWKDISRHSTNDPKLKNKLVVIHIRAENSKTGKAGNIVAPVKRRLDVIKQSYKDMGFNPQPNDFVLFNIQNKNRSAYTRQTFYWRLQATLKISGLMEELVQYQSKISLYSFRHQYICWRLRYGNVPIHLIAKQCRTSIQKIDETYGHIEVEKQAELLTANQGYMRKAEVDLSTFEFDD
jgi:integrase